VTLISVPLAWNLYSGSSTYSPLIQTVTTTTSSRPSSQCPNSLESPCFPHMFATTETRTTGHALCFSATVLHHHPHHALIPQRSAGKPTWQVPASSIERLLELSSSVPLQDSELTPVQVWDAVRRHEGLWELEIERLEGLKERLVREVKCYGYVRRIR
jgi:hypothetical protein